MRSDRQSASGYTLSSNAAKSGWDYAGQKPVNYSVDHNSYSLGANYSLDKASAIFVRASDGVAYSADRLLYGNALDGSVPIAINQIQQQEVGYKWRGRGLSVFATLFN